MKNTTIKEARCVTVKELIEVLKNMPQDSMINIDGASRFTIDGISNDNIIFISTPCNEDYPDSDNLEKFGGELFEDVTCVKFKDHEFNGYNVYFTPTKDIQNDTLKIYNLMYIFKDGLSEGYFYIPYSEFKRTELDILDLEFKSPDLIKLDSITVFNMVKEYCDKKN